MVTGIKDITGDVICLLHADIQAALRMLETQKTYFGRETFSTAIGEVSERLIADYLKGARRDRGSKGHDVICEDGKKHEVKARLVNKHKDSVQFNFGKHTQGTDTAFCVVWSDAPQLEIVQVFWLPVSELHERWGSNVGRYYARTTLGKLKRACLESERIAC